MRGSRGFRRVSLFLLVVSSRGFQGAVAADISVLARCPLGGVCSRGEDRCGAAISVSSLRSWFNRYAVGFSGPCGPSPGLVDTNLLRGCVEEWHLGALRFKGSSN